MRCVLIGVGGAGMSALAELLVELHIPNIFGVDSVASTTSDHLKQLGINIQIGHGTIQIQPHDLIIYSAATKDSPEVVAGFALTQADPLNPPPMLYAEFLGEISKYLYTVAISGTHGKSTTTGMIATAAAKLLPETALAIVGAGVTERTGNHCRHNPAHRSQLHEIILHIISPKHSAAPRELKKLLFVVEADEFNHHFLMLSPDVSVITSIDHDHVDIYPTRESYLEAFGQFFANTREQIFVSEQAAKIVDKTAGNEDKLITVSQEQFSFAHLIGGHNHANASLAAATLSFLATTTGAALSNDIIHTTLEQRTGISRRAELLGTTHNNVMVFSDYGHHPAEISSTLQAFAQTYSDKKLVTIFEAHQARRLLEFRDGFVEATQAASHRFVVPCYTAREQRSTFAQTVATQFPQSANLNNFDELGAYFAQCSDATYIPSFSDLPHYLDQLSDCLVIGFSAGILDEHLRKEINNAKLIMQN